MTMTDYQQIGKWVPIDNAESKVTGDFTYVDDLKVHGMLYGKVLFSTVPHAKILSIDASAAAALPGVRAVATYQNTPQVRYNSTTRFFLQKPIETERVFDDTVRFVGDRVAAVAADTLAIAEAAVKLIRVEYQPLPHYVDAEAALAATAYPLHGGENNIAVEVKQNAGDVEAAFAQADYVFEDRYTTPAVHHGAIETHTVIADYDKTGRLTVIAPFQNNFSLRIVLSRIFNLPLSKIQVRTPGLGGAFGGKLEASLEPVAAVLSQLAGKPVKLTYNRKESMLGTRTRHAATVDIKTGIMRDGTIVATDFQVVTNTGAYGSSALNVIGAMSQKVFKTYQIPNLRFTARAVYTNTPVAGAMRGYGSPQAFFAQQCQMLKIAKALNLDYYQLQQKNMVDPDGVDQRNQQPIGNPHPKDCLQRALELSQGWQPVEPDDRWAYGVGMAMGAHGSSAYGAHLDQTSAIIKMNDDGSCVLYVAAHEMGQAITTTLRQVVAEVLHLPLNLVQIVAGDTDSCPWSLGDFSSRGAYVSCYAAKKTAELVAKKLLAEAAAMLQTDPSVLELGAFCVKSKATGACLSFDRIMDHAQNISKKDIICSSTHPASASPGSYGAHICRVRVDKTTGQAAVTDYVAVHDVGQVLNRCSIEGQLYGAIQMGLGYALQEYMHFDANGKTRQCNFRQYKMLTASQMPNIQLDFIEAGEPTGPFGAKSIAECAIVPCAPAVINAITNATGLEIHSLPYQPKPLQKE